MHDLTGGWPSKSRDVFVLWRGYRLLNFSLGQELVEAVEKIDRGVVLSVYNTINSSPITYVTYPLPVEKLLKLFPVIFAYGDACAIVI
jgi:hypothetical protein